MPLCYKDRVYCASDCIVASCNRYVDDEVIEESIKHNLSISYMNLQLGCSFYTPGRENPLQNKLEGYMTFNNLSGSKIASTSRGMTKPEKAEVPTLITCSRCDCLVPPDYICDHPYCPNRLQFNAR